MTRVKFLPVLVAAAGSVGLMHLHLGHLESEVSGGPEIPILVAVDGIPIGAALSETSLAVQEMRPKRAHVPTANPRTP